MSGTAVVLAGVPGPAFDETVEAIRNAFPVGYVVRGIATRVYARRRASYDHNQIGHVLSAAGDAVFGHSGRSFSFCRHPQRICAKRGSGKTCGLQGTQSCPLAAPSRLILLYQQGDGELNLISRLHYAALHSSIPQQIYNDRHRTAQHCVDQVRTLSAKANQIESAMTSRNTPLLLPPKNFGENGAVGNLLDLINACADVGKSSTAFRRTFFERDQHRYAGGRNLGYKPAERTEQHGKAGEEEPIQLALPKAYRLGCTYDNSRHWDVSLRDGTKFKGKLGLTCREHGRQFPKGSHVNIWPDDWIGKK